MELTFRSSRFQIKNSPPFIRLVDMASAIPLPRQNIMVKSLSEQEQPNGFRLNSYEVPAILTVDTKICHLLNLNKLSENVRAKELRSLGFPFTDFAEGMRMFIRESLRISEMRELEDLRVIDITIIESIVHSLKDEIENDGFCHNEKKMDGTKRMAIFRSIPEWERGIELAARTYV